LKHLILFDLDGTLTESGPGITKSVQYALRKFGIEEPDPDKLRVFVGPPLIEMFQQYAGLSKEDAKAGVVYYREYFQAKGIFENALYPGISEMLLHLKEKGFVLGIASSKPEPYVLQIADYFDITRFFDVIVGSTMAETRTKKSEVIEEALLRYAAFLHGEEVSRIQKEDSVLTPTNDQYGANAANNRAKVTEELRNAAVTAEQHKAAVAAEQHNAAVTEELRNTAVMVGDKSHDILGAREAGLRCVGVLYGYGTKEEIDGAAPFAEAQTVEELEAILLKLI